MNVEVMARTMPNRAKMREESLRAELEKWSAVEDVAFEKLIQMRNKRHRVRFHRQKEICREIAAIVVELREEVAKWQ